MLEENVDDSRSFPCKLQNVSGGVFHYYDLKDFLEENKESFTEKKAQYLHLLSMLTEIGEMTDTVFMERIEKIYKYGKIIICTESKQIIASGTLIIEQKIIRNGKSVGHIEDIVVHKDYRGNKISENILNILKKNAQENNCYKVILDCEDSLVTLYKKTGFIKKGVQMGIYF